MTKANNSSKNSVSSGDESSSIKDGTIHVRILRAKGLPTMDFGKQQDPYVLVKLEGSEPLSWGKTDPVFEGGVNPEWTEHENNEIELFYDATLGLKEDVLTFEVFTDDSGTADLIGTGQLNVSKIVRTQQKTEMDFTIRLGAQRGELFVQVWYGPPIRKAFRAAQRASKLLDARDSLVQTLWAALLGLAEKASKRINAPTDYLKKNRKLSAALAVVLGIIVAGIAGVFLTIAVPTAIVAAFTFPFWIIPFILTTLMTSPVWIPILLVAGGVIAFFATFVLGLGVTSRPVRRKGAFLTTKIKQTEVGKRVVYEKDL